METTASGRAQLRTISVIAIVAVVLASCQSSGDSNSRAARPVGDGTGPPPPPGSEPAQAGVDHGVTPWEGARTASTQRQLVLSFVGGSPGLTPDAPCWEGYRPEVRRERTRVVITVHELHTPPSPNASGEKVGCLLPGYARTLTVDLSEELSGRELVDGAASEARQVFDGSSLLEIGWRPNRWELTREQMWAAGRDEGPAWRRDFCPSETVRQGRPQVDGSGCFTIVQGPASVAEPGRDRRIIDTRVVRGVDGRVITDWRHNYAALTWTEGDQGIVVESSWIGEEVVQVARKLH